MNEEEQARIERARLEAEVMEKMRAEHKTKYRGWIAITNDLLVRHHTVRGARKEYVCKGCGKPIRKGEPYKEYMMAWNPFYENAQKNIDKHHLNC